MVATGVGIAAGQPAVPIAECQHGREVALCAGEPAGDEEAVDREEIVIPSEPVVSNPPPPPAQTVWVWEREIEREANQAAQANLRHQHNQIAPFATSAPSG
jgi:hypothetical protein